MTRAPSAEWNDFGMQTILDIDRLSIQFDTDEGVLTAVDDVSLSLRRGEIVGLVGESGCGKSVTALSILRLIPSPPGRIAAGSVRFEGRDLLQLPARDLREIRGRRISMIFQEPMSALSPLHRIGDQLVETLRLHGSMTAPQARRVAEDWLRQVGIPDASSRMQDYPFNLSGGMLQRVMIAMALMLEPSILIADEPTTALDVTIQAQILDLLRARRSQDTSLLLITHDLGVVWEMCDRVLVMYAGRIVEEGPLRSVFESPAHPYTEALLRSVTSLADGNARLSSIPGQVPSALRYPAGCRFAPRCPRAFDRCRQELPTLLDIDGERRSACFLAYDLLHHDG